MDIYPKNYRTIYENHYGSIPKDNDGKTYEIHHIDGNRNNNDPSNLMALSIQEHYDIHYKQGDYNACFIISQRMSLSPETISELQTAENNSQYDHTIYHFIHKSGKTYSGTQNNFYKKYNLNKSNVCQMVKSNPKYKSVKGWSIVGRNIKNNSYDYTIYHFIHKSGETYIGLQSDFRKKYNLYHVDCIIHGKRKSTKGWSIKQ